MIAVVIPVHNRIEFTVGCLKSLQRQTRQAEYIIVVDDGSTDGTSRMLQKYFPSVVVLDGDGNLYWTAAINMGVRKALELGVEYVVTLNNDTIPSETFLEELLKGASMRPDSLIGALDIDADTRRKHYGGEIIDWKSNKSEYLLDTLKNEEQHGLHEVSLFPARGLLIPRIVFDRIGLFCEKKLPHYMADYDFTQQARKNGFKVYCNYDAVLYTYPDEGGDHKIREQKTIRNYFEHLFGLKGGGNLRNFTIYTLRNCPPKYLLPSLLSGYIRRIGGFWIK